MQGPPGEGCLSGAGDDAGAQFQPLQFTLAQLAATDGGEVTGRKRAQRMLTAANETLTFEARHTGVGDAAKACTYVAPRTPSALLPAAHAHTMLPAGACTRA
ncbi:hypothetical protein EON67_05965 [archaeon]|nr:MAG: hypothetical protein EON67_05965 [archaeon]